jgi:UDP-glucose 4-epimerase
VSTPALIESLAKIGAVLTCATLIAVIVGVRVLAVVARPRVGSLPAGDAEHSGAHAADIATAAAGLAAATPAGSARHSVPSLPGEHHTMKRVLVTGGAGFIGSHIAEAFVAAGLATIVLDDLSTGLREQVPDRARFIQADISDPATADLIASLHLDLVIHAAAQVSVSGSMADPARDRAVNLGGTQHVLQGARAAGASRFVFISSGGAIYGDTPAANELAVPAPANFYGIHKLAAEGYVEVSGMSYGIVRFANVYGPRQRAGLEGGVVAVFLDALRANKPVTVYGSGEQVRDFLHVDDAVSGVLTIAASSPDGIWNVGTGVATSINELLVDLQRSVGYVPLIVRADRRNGDVESSRLLIDRIREDLGWMPRISLAAGIHALAAGSTRRESGESRHRLVAALR